MTESMPGDAGSGRNGRSRYRSGSLLPPDRYRRARSGRFAEAVAVFAGGAAGTLLRVLLAEAFPAARGGWPWPTLLANLLGAFLAGWFVVRLAGGRHAGKHPLLITGFCGGLTTFSTLQVELLDLLDAGRTGTAALYAALSLVAGVLLFLAGSRLGRRGPGRGRSGEPA